MESFGHKIFISSKPVPLTGTGVLYPRLRDFSGVVQPQQLPSCQLYELLDDELEHLVLVKLLEEESKL